MLLALMVLHIVDKQPPRTTGQTGSLFISGCGRVDGVGQVTSIWVPRGTDGLYGVGSEGQGAASGQSRNKQKLTLMYTYYTWVEANQTQTGTFAESWDG